MSLPGNFWLPKRRAAGDVSPAKTLRSFREANTAAEAAGLWWAHALLRPQPAVGEVIISAAERTPEEIQACYEKIGQFARNVTEAIIQDGLTVVESARRQRQPDTVLLEALGGAGIQYRPQLLPIGNATLVDAEVGTMSVVAGTREPRVVWQAAAALGAAEIAA